VQEDQTGPVCLAVNPLVMEAMQWIQFEERHGPVSGGKWLGESGPQAVRWRPTLVVAKQSSVSLTTGLPGASGKSNREWRMITQPWENRPGGRDSDEARNTCLKRTKRIVF
jgi:hypothetical protein